MNEWMNDSILWTLTPGKTRKDVPLKVFLHIGVDGYNMIMRYNVLVT